MQKLFISFATLLVFGAGSVAYAQQTLPPGNYAIQQVDGARLVVAEDQKLAITGMVLTAPEYSAGNDGVLQYFRFAPSFPHRPQWDEQQNAFLVNGTMTGTVHNRACRYTFKMLLRHFGDELEVTIVHPTKIYSPCDSFGTLTRLLNAVKS